MSDTPLLELRGVQVFYGAVQVLFEIDLQIQAGELVCLLGGNASGNSTTLKTSLGLVKPQRGQVLLNGVDITTWPTPQRVRAGLGSVPEARRIFPQMTVAENLLMGAYQRRDTAAVQADYERVLAWFPVLGERLHQRGGTLSGGEQQMLAFGRALLGRPKLICMDEPTMGLAPVLVGQVLAHIQQMHHAGTTILMVEQNANLALKIAQRAYVLQEGRIVLAGAASDLLNSPAVQKAYLGTASA